MKRYMLATISWCTCVSTTNAAQLSMSLGSRGEAGPSSSILRLDIVWTMQPTDAAQYDIDGFSYRFNVDYPEGSSGQLIVDSIELLPGWIAPATEGIGEPFTEVSFFFGADDPTYEGISGNTTEFSTVIASVLLRVQGDVAGTEITFRHNSYQDPLPAAYDGPTNWQLRWQEEVTGPFQFDIGAGNPGDDENWNGPYHGNETYQPLIIPEPGSLALLALAALASCRRPRSRP